MAHDLIIAGGGIAGSTLGILMARSGASVLILEREQHHRDRIRGEGLHPWAVAEARATGLYAVLLERCGHLVPVIARYSDGCPASSRDLVATTPSGDPMLTWYHPDVQHVLNDCAVAAGADLLRGARVTAVCPGQPPGVVVTHEGRTQRLFARLVVGADGRRSTLRSLAGFAVTRDPDNLLMAGVLVSGLRLDERASQICSRDGAACMTQFLPLGRGRHRLYFVTGDREHYPPIGGRAGLVRLLAYLRDCAVPEDWLDTLSVDGPLATFEGASWWVEQPYRDGIALIGDAAAAPDPSFGSGQGMALRDARVLSECLLADCDWDRAATRYAAEHDASFTRLRTLEGWMSEAVYSVSPELQAVREHAEAAWERGDAPDLNGKGPDQPVDDGARMRFLGY